MTNFKTTRDGYPIHYVSYIITFSSAQYPDHDDHTIDLHFPQSKLHLVDLAGSERSIKTQSTGVVQKEAKYINKSLSFLEQVVLALTQSKRDHIPYRQSKLTYMLKDSLVRRLTRLVLFPSYYCHLAIASLLQSYYYFARSTLHSLTHSPCSPGYGAICAGR